MTGRFPGGFMQTELNKVVAALQEFYAQEAFLFEHDLGERVLRLPHGTIVSTDDHLAKSVYPDIVVHQRDIPNNLLAVEVRKAGNHQPPEHDRHKLSALTDPHLGFAYWIGVWLVLGWKSVVSDVYVAGVIDHQLSAWLAGRLREAGL